jgi:hypothetical protein
MNTDYQDDFFWSAVQVGEKYYVVMDYYLIAGTRPSLGEPFDTKREASHEADVRNARSR